MAHHDLKIHEQPFNDLLSGAKTCEVRNNDRGFQVGDTVQLHEIADTFTGRVMVRKITHVQTGYGLPDGLCVLSYAQLPSQGGEAVAVVAYHGKDPDGGEGFVGARWPNAFGEDCIVEPLMTVAQHQRILAASVGSAEPVAYAAFADNGNIRMWCRSAIGMCELFDAHGNKAVPLYTHPADQVAGDLTMVKVSRELLERLYTSNSKYQFDPKTYWPAHEELRAMLAKSEGVKP